MKKLVHISFVCLVSILLSGCIENEISDLDLRIMNPFDQNYIGENYLKISNVIIKQYPQYDTEICEIEFKFDWDNIKYIKEDEISPGAMFYGRDYIVNLINPNTNEFVELDRLTNIRHFHEYKTEFALPINTMADWDMVKCEVILYDYPEDINAENPRAIYELTFRL